MSDHTLRDFFLDTWNAICGVHVNVAEQDGEAVEKAINTIPEIPLPVKPVIRLELPREGDAAKDASDRFNAAFPPFPPTKPTKPRKHAMRKKRVKHKITAR